jgi:hypothetical protein
VFRNDQRRCGFLKKSTKGNFQKDHWEINNTQILRRIIDFSWHFTAFSVLFEHFNKQKLNLFEIFFLLFSVFAIFDMRACPLNEQLNWK